MLSSFEPKMSEMSEYAVPLVVRYDNLIAIIGEKKELAVKSALSSSPEKREDTETFSFHGRDLRNSQFIDSISALNNVLFKLQQWSDKLSYESSTKIATGPDVLEALEASDTQLISTIHKILTEIALKVERYPSGFVGNLFKQVAILQSSIL